MHNFNKINTLTGWFIFAIATLVYWLTVEPTAGFWDVGEFIAVSYKLEVPHPPGAPFFLLIGRMFSFLAMGDVTQVAYWINIVSVLCSGFTILFLFWSISLLGRKILKVKDNEVSTSQLYMLMGSSAIGALAYTFSDSFWFSAVEAEVYAMSSFFTAFVFWAILKWELVEDESLANKWLILIAYMMGLSIGVHLLNLVTIPALALIYYYKNHKITTWGLIATMLISLLIIGVIMVGIIPGLPSVAGAVEIYFVNSLGLPFGSGIIFFSLLVIGGLVYGIIHSYKKEKVILNTALLSLAFVLIGYASYAIIVIRSGYDPPIDENDPENIISVVSYLKREQYGSRPLLHGQYFTAEVIDQKEGAKVYVKGEEKYEVADRKLEYVYDPAKTTILPRIYSTDHAASYRSWLGLSATDEPTFGDNLSFMFTYQLGKMYMRYFMWNFAGRESDVQDAGWLSPFDAGKEVPEVLAENKARNNYFMLPLILGLVGLFYQYRRDQLGFSVVAMLFFLTGIALVLYLNSPPVEPRERDYIYVGSFYAFAMWIGFGVMALTELLSKWIKNQAVAPVAATVICLAVPGIMAAEGWDDHDRSNRYFSVDQAKNLLNSCAPNAILFTGGDNDTFPLWYVQEVEGFRTDVRVIVLTYLNTDWYIEQMTRQAYESEPLPFSLTQELYRQGGPNDYLPVVENPNIKGAINLEQFMDLVRKNHKAIQVPTSSRGFINTVPSKSVYLNIDTAAVLEKGIIPETQEELLQEQMVIPLKGRAIYKNDLMILDLFANNNWERPIYFNNTSLQNVNLDLKAFAVQEGATYRILPVQNPNPNVGELVDTETMYENMMTKFHWRELDNPNVNYALDYRKAVTNHRAYFNSLTAALLEEGKTEMAKEVVFKNLELMPDEAIPFDYTISETVNYLLTVGETERALEIANMVAVRADDELTYYSAQPRVSGYEIQTNLFVLNGLIRNMKTAGQAEAAKKYEEIFMKHYGSMN